MKTQITQKKDGFKGEWMYVLPTTYISDFIGHPIVSRLYITDVGFFPHAKYHYRQRTDGFLENIYIYCMDGSGTIKLSDGTIHTLHANDAFCIPAGIGHEYYASEDTPWSILWMHFKGTDTALYPLHKKEVIHLDNASAHMHTLFNSLYEVLEQNYDLNNFIFITGVVSLILSTTYFHVIDSKPDLITAIIRYMYEQIESTLTLEDLCQKFQLSKSQLSAQFKDSTGHSPMDFFNRIKIEEACKLLTSTDLYIYEIANKLGFQDQYYFSRLFKKIVGISPRAYQKH